MEYYPKGKPFIAVKNGELLPSLDAAYGPWNSADDFITWLHAAANSDTKLPQSGTRIAIYNENGTIKEYRYQNVSGKSVYLEEIHAGDISSDNVTVGNQTLTEKLNEITNPEYDAITIAGAVYFDSIAALKASTDLSAGDIVVTRGFYEANDGGGSVFRVVSKTSDAMKIYEGAHSYRGYAYDLTWSNPKSDDTSPYVDDATLVALQNDLYADIIVPENMEVNFLQLGAKQIYSYYRAINSVGHYYSVQEDNKPYMLKWLAFNDRRMTTYNLFVPAGAYSFSETWLLRNTEPSCDCGIRIRGECSQYNATGTVFIPHKEVQEYIIRIGFKTVSEGVYATTNGANNTEIWRPMRASVLNNIAFGTTWYSLNHTGYKLKYGAAGIASINDSTHIIQSTGNTASAGANGYRYVTKGALWLDSCPFSQFDGLYFISVAGTCMYMTQCYESHFGYTNIRNCGMITDAGVVPPLVRFNAPGASDISACYFYYFNFENSIGNYFYSDTNNFAHNEFNDIQIEGSANIGTSLPVISLIARAAGTTPYDTDPDYVEPTFTDEDDNATAVFGRWYKMFVFTGNVGHSPIHVNTITATNFGNGFQRYRTYEIGENSEILDANGNTVTENYTIEDGICYALDEDTGLKIIDYYRYYALVGEDEEDGTPQSLVITVNNTYLQRQEGMTSFNGPWVLYLRNKANIHSVRMLQTYGRDEYPYFLEGTRRVALPKESCKIPGAMPFIDLMKDESYQAWETTRSGALSQHGMVVKRTHNSGISFIAMPNTRYMIRAYATQSLYNYLLTNQKNSSNVAYMKWTNIVCIGTTSNPYTGVEEYPITRSGWLNIPLPDFGITEPTEIILYQSQSGNGISQSFLLGLYLDLVVPFGMPTKSTEFTAEDGAVFRIVDDIDFDGAEIELGANTQLIFEGGSISNVTITGSNTSITAAPVQIFGSDVVFDGTWNVRECYPEWWGAKGDGTTDDLTAFDEANNSPFYEIKLLAKTYIISNGIWLRQGKSIEGISVSSRTQVPALKVSSSVDTSSPIDYMLRLSSNCNIRNFLLWGDGRSYYGIYGVSSNGSADSDPHRLNIEGIAMYNFKIGLSLHTFLTRISGCSVTGARVGFQLLGGTSTTMINCYVKGFMMMAYFIKSMTYSSMINCCADTCHAWSDGTRSGSTNPTQTESADTVTDDEKQSILGDYYSMFYGFTYLLNQCRTITMVSCACEDVVKGIFLENSHVVRIIGTTMDMQGVTRTSDAGRVLFSQISNHITIEGMYVTDWAGNGWETQSDNILAFYSGSSKYNVVVRNFQMRSYNSSHVDTTWFLKDSNIRETGSGENTLTIEYDRWKKRGIEGGKPTNLGWIVGRGFIYYNTTKKIAEMWTGTRWVELICNDDNDFYTFTSETISKLYDELETYDTGWVSGSSLVQDVSDQEWKLINGMFYNAGIEGVWDGTYSNAVGEYLPTTIYVPDEGTAIYSVWFRVYEGDIISVTTARKGKVPSAAPTLLITDSDHKITYRKVSDNIITGYDDNDEPIYDTDTLIEDSVSNYEVLRDGYGFVAVAEGGEESLVITISRTTKVNNIVSRLNALEGQ